MPDDALERLRAAAAEAPLPPLRIEAGGGSTRPGPLGAGVNRLRAAILRLLTPSLAGLVAQLERDRHRLRGEVAELRARVERLERDRPSG